MRGGCFTPRRNRWPVQDSTKSSWGIAEMSLERKRLKMEHLVKSVPDRKSENEAARARKERGRGDFLCSLLLFLAATLEQERNAGIRGEGGKRIDGTSGTTKNFFSAWPRTRRP